MFITISFFIVDWIYKLNSQLFFIYEFIIDYYDAIFYNILDGISCFFNVKALVLKGTLDPFYSLLSIAVYYWNVLSKIFEISQIILLVLLLSDLYALLSSKTIIHD
ncbi:hypothetical protein DBR43_09990 [Pedobacter sp. KBW06]|nr:hypothetical protein DBR43_09990 [Pedobacter sp. KBW06]